MTSQPVAIEILLHPPTETPTIPQSSQLHLLQTTVERSLQSHVCTTTKLPLPDSLNQLRLPTATGELQIQEINMTLSEDDATLELPHWRVYPTLHLYTYSPLHYTPPPGTVATPLPTAVLHGHWENLHFGHPIKSLLLSYVHARYKYALPSSGFVLLHGPPGTGKSSLAEGLAQKVGVRLGQGALVRLTHEVLSKYFGESANRVDAVFKWAVEQRCRVVIIIDEIESFGMCRNEQGDNIRVTNALITGLDAIKPCHNVFVVGTSNCVANVDGAICDRADVCVRVCEMGNEGRGMVLRRALEGLVERGLIDCVGDCERVLEECEGIGVRRVEGCVVIAMGMVEKGVAWGVFEKALRKAFGLARGVFEEIEE